MNIDKIFNCEATGFTQLMLCALNNDLESALEHLSEINDENSEKSTALHIACRNSAKSNSVEMIDFLLRNGADPNIKDIYGWTPLHHASRFSAEGSSLATVEALLRSGADPNAKDNEGWTPLHHAATYSNTCSSLATVEALLRNGADPNSKSNYGFTPLHYTLGECSNFLDSLETFKLLLRYNATPINELTTKLKLEIDINDLIEDNKMLQQRISILESELD